MGLLQDFHNCQTEFDAWFIAALFMMIGMVIMIFIQLIAERYNKRNKT